MGRPPGGSIFKPEFSAEVEKLCLLGADLGKIADFFKVTKKTVYQWQKDHPEFFAAMRQGKVKANANVATALYRRAVGYKHKAVKIFMPAGADAPVYAPYVEHYPPDTAAATFWLKNNDPENWKDKHEIEATVRTVEQLSDEQLAALGLALELTEGEEGVFALPSAPDAGEKE